MPDAASSPDPPNEPTGAPRRKPRHVRAAARLLQKEARRILRRHGRRIDADAQEAILASVAALDDALARRDFARAEAEAEHLDELLERHAAFARKSALRETLENVAVAVIVALGLRACVYEPFQIPSGSMMPTLLPGDHIFVNKFVYGVQVPFTNHVVGRQWGKIGRGDVVVFRYPLDESDDYIKRVIGLPGDVIEVRGRQVFVKKAGEDRFEAIPQEPLEERCRDESGTKIVANCRLYRERYGGHTYVVRYVRPDLPPLQDPMHFEVPEGSLFVMGDNRNQSEDSRAWHVTVEAVAADRVLPIDDVRAVTGEPLFTMQRKADGADPKQDAVVYTADHRSTGQSMVLEVFRAPLWGPSAVRGALVPDGRTAGADELAQLEPKAKEILAAFDELRIDRDAESFVVVGVHEPTQSALSLRCGREACPTASAALGRAAEAMGAYLKVPTASARDLLWDEAVGARGVQVVSGPPRDAYVFRGRGEGGAVEVEALRNPPYGIERALDMAFAALGRRRGSVPHDPDLPVPGGLSWTIARTDGGFDWIGVDLARRFLVHLGCAPRSCRDRKTLARRLRPIIETMADAATDPRAFRDLARAWGIEAVPAADETPGGAPAFEKVLARTSADGPAYEVRIHVRYRPKRGLAAALAAEADPRAAPLSGAPPGTVAWSAPDGTRTALVPVERSRTLVRIDCAPGLCSEEGRLAALARRAFERAGEPENFVDPQASRPRPFVPRGNVKGRADRIWWPPKRFWKKID